MAEREPRTLVRAKTGIFKLFSDDTILLIGGRLSYPHVATAQKNVAEDGTETFSFNTTVLLPKTTHTPAKEECVKLMNKLMAGKKFKIPASKKFIKNGDALDDDGERLMGPECEGMWVVSAREANRPKLRSNKNDPTTGKPARLTPEQAANMFYGGCYGNVLIRPWLMENKYGKRLNAGLSAVQFLKDGEPFGQRLRDDDIDDSFDGEDADDSGGWGDDNDDL